MQVYGGFGSLYKEHWKFIGGRKSELASLYTVMEGQDRLRESQRGHRAKVTMKMQELKKINE
jgi:hypothetical protein